MNNVFVLKVITKTGEWSVILGESYSKVTIGLATNPKDNCATSAVIRDCREEIETNTGHPFDVLDFIVPGSWIDGDIVHPITKDYFGEDSVECFYITLNGNTIDKVVPKEKPDREVLDMIWKKHIPDLKWDWEE